LVAIIGAIGIKGEVFGQQKEKKVVKRTGNNKMVIRFAHGKQSRG